MSPRSGNGTFRTMLPTTSHELFAAIDADDETAVRAALAGDPALARSRDDDGVSATMHALYHGRRAIAEAIAATLTELDIFEAAALARTARVEELVTRDRSLATALSPDGFTALHYPAFFGGDEAAETARVLLDAGADVNARSANGFSVLPLHSAVAGDHEAVAIALIEAGADAVVGHGPHVLRGVEFYRSRPIVYSLGNFLTYRGFNLSGPLGITGVLQLELAGDGAYRHGRLVPMVQVPRGGPVEDPTGAALLLIRDLSREDFGPTAAAIGPEGEILPPPVP